MENSTLQETTTKPSKKDFCKLCLKLGLVLAINYVSRIAGTVILSVTDDSLSSLGITGAYAVQSLISFIFLYVIPFTLTICILGYQRPGKVREMYAKPGRMGKALANFPNLYGLTVMVNIMTVVVLFLFSLKDFGKSLNTVNSLTTTNIPCALILLFQLVVIAPLFEEYWFRGAVFTSLQKYGVGFAIIVSGIMFGLTHANFNQFFYTTVTGICLAYIRYATGSIIPTTILHAMLNSIMGITMVFFATPSIQNYIMHNFSVENPSDGDTAVLIMFIAFTLVAMMLAFFGALSAIPKIKQIIRSYNIPHVWTEISTAKKSVILLTTITVIIALILAADLFTGNYIIRFFTGLFS